MKNYIESELFSIPHNPHFINRYIKFIQACVYKNKDVDSNTENHHILPKSIFPKYKTTEDNIAKLSYREHYIAHWILAKCFFGDPRKKMVFAFSLIIGKRQSSFTRTFTSKQSHRAKSYRHSIGWSEESKKKVSETRRGTVPVRYPCGRTCVVSVDHPDYIEKICVPVITGRKANPETLAKMSKINKGKVLVNRGGKNIYVTEILDTDQKNTLDIPTRCKIRFSGTKTYYNPNTNEEIKIKGDPPDGFILGRRPLKRLTTYKNICTGDRKSFEFGDTITGTLVPVTTKAVFVDNVRKVIYSSIKIAASVFCVSDDLLYRFCPNKLPPKTATEILDKNKSWNDNGIYYIRIDKLTNYQINEYDWIHSKV